MKSISKTELLKLIDTQLPDDARIGLFSSMVYEFHTIDEAQIAELFMQAEEAFEGDEDSIVKLGDTTHVLVSS